MTNRGSWPDGQAPSRIGSATYLRQQGRQKRYRELIVASQICEWNRDNVSEQRSTLVLRPCTKQPEKQELGSERSRRL
jgi:hypothetical protein